MVTSSETALLTLADCYEAAVLRHGGRSLTRVATIVASRGTFFVPLREGKTCTARNLDAFASYFADSNNWPTQAIPDDALAAIERLGHHRWTTDEAAHS